METDMLDVTFEFCGGPHDGKVTCGRLGEGGDAERYYLFTNHGTVGYLFKIASDYTVETLAREGLQARKRHNFQKHFYVVAQRAEDDGEVYVKAEYISDAVKADKQVS